jgi:hypothetical protein
MALHWLTILLCQRYMCFDLEEIWIFASSAMFQYPIQCHVSGYPPRESPANSPHGIAQSCASAWFWRFPSSSNLPSKIRCLCELSDCWATLHQVQLLMRGALFRLQDKMSWPRGWSGDSNLIFKRPEGQLSVSKVSWSGHAETGWIVNL